MRLTSLSRSEKRRQRERSTRRRMLMEQLERREVLTGLPPAVMNDAFSVNPDQTLDIDAPGILANDADAEGDAMSAVLFSGPQHGSLSLNADGSFSYTPESGYAGIDSFMYRADDGTSLSGLAAVTIRIEANESPVAEDDTFNMSEGSVLSIGAPGLLANDSDPEGDALSAELVAGPTNGLLTLNADGSFEYTPNDGFSGADAFTYSASDGSSSSNTATVTINVNDVNAIPEIGNDSYAVDEDTPLIVDAAGGLLANDSDADGDPLSAVLVSGPANGTLTLNADGSLEYIPNADFNGVDGFSYLVNDGTDDSDVATVMIDVNPVNDLPIAVNDEFTTDEDTPLTVSAPGMLENDSDLDGDELSSVLVSGPANGTLSVNPDGSFEYTPAADFNGVDGFSYKVSDGTGESDVATVTINVSAINDDPTAADDAYSTDEDTPLVIAAAGVLENDADVDGDPLTAVLGAGPANGTVTLNADGSFEYMPNADFNGDDSFTYTASDGTGASAEATVTITVNSVNDAPSATDDLYATEEDTALVVDAAGGVLANDTDVEGDALSAILVAGPTGGSVTLNADGSFEYTPNADFNGIDSFTYTASDGSAESGETTVTINVNSVNDAPVAANDEYATDEDVALDIPAPGILGNDSDIDGDALSAVMVAGPANGTVSINPDGSFTYTPNADFNGVDGFSYQVSDGTELSDVATVMINVCPVNDDPTAVEDAFSTDEDTALVVDAAGGVLANDTDPDGDPLTAILGTGPANGSLTLNADGSFEYIPNADFNGSDSFTYKVSDGTTESAETTVSITVNAINDDPTAVEDAYSTDEDTALVVDAAGGVLANDTDPDGDPLTAILGAGPANGTITLNADGSFEYTPNADFNGSDSFTYKVSDGTSESEEVTVALTVNVVNDAPTSADDAYSVDENTSLVVDAAGGVLANDADPDGDMLSAIIVSGPANGTLTLDASGSFEYTPNAGFSGTDTFTYMANDGTADSAESTVTITVNDVNSAPTARNDSYSMAEDGTLATDADSGVLRNDTDAEGDSLSAIMVDGPSHGTLTLNADGSFSYTPDTDFNGQDTFTYQANDGTESSETVTVTININSVNDAPLADDDEYVTLSDAPLTVDAEGGVLANDSDVDGDTLTATLIQPPSSGSLTLNSDGSFTYTPQSDFVGEDTFTYQVNDGEADGNVATVRIVVGQANGTPVAADDSLSVVSGNTLNVDAPGILANDTDGDGDPLTASLVSGPANGSLTLNADGSLSYTPNAGFTGADSFTYMANDGTVDGNVATVTIDVQAAAPVPRNVVGVNDRYTLEQDTTLSIAAPGVLENDTDADGDGLSAVLFSDVQHGTLVLNADGSFDYTPEAGYVGTDSFVYRATDGANFSLLTAVTLRVTAAPAQSPIPEPIPNPCTCADDEEESSDALEAPQADPLDSLAIVEGDAGEDQGDLLDDVIEDVLGDDGEEDTDSVDDFFTTVGSCA